MRTVYRSMELGSTTVDDGQALWNRGCIPLLLSTDVHSIHGCKVRSAVATRTVNRKMPPVLASSGGECYYSRWPSSVSLIRCSCATPSSFILVYCTCCKERWQSGGGRSTSQLFTLVYYTSSIKQAITTGQQTISPESSTRQKNGLLLPLFHNASFRYNNLVQLIRFLGVVYGLTSTVRFFCFLLVLFSLSFFSGPFPSVPSYIHYILYIQVGYMYPYISI